MSEERSRLVRVPIDGERAALIRQVVAARARARKAAPGDRTEVVRYESLCTRLEQVAAAELRDGAEVLPLPLAPVAADRDSVVTDEQGLPPGADGARPWLAAGDVAVELRDPFGSGPTLRPRTGLTATEPAPVWRAPAGAGAVEGRQAVELRFRQRLAAALDGGPGAAVEPGGISNSVLTEELHRSVGEAGTRRDVPVRYRDGSLAAPFPLRSLRFDPAATRVARPCTLRLALLSIRHTEMDAAVDGAWLRNVDVSRPRPMGDTDRLVHATSVRQLAELTAERPVALRLYQTGLDAAVVGFYRAVTELLLARPGAVTVVPMYFRRRPAGAGPRGAGDAPRSSFEEGSPWAV